ncbi:MAG: low temperature requirement protein A, partial [Mycobacterium sp.]|nr:low temperature requirement protein A [Mycobacterium sp.]
SVVGYELRGHRHAAAYYIEHHSELGSVATVLSVVIPVGVYIVMVYALYAVMTHTFPVLHVLLIAGVAAVLGLAVLLAANGISMANCLLVVTLAPVVSVVGYELRGHRHAAQAVARTGG